MLDRRDVERPGQRGEAVAAVGVGVFFEIVTDQSELRVARARVDEVVEQLGKSAHRASQCASGVAVPELVETNGQGGEYRVAVALGVAVERGLDMLEAGLHRDAVAGQERQLRGPAGEPFERGEAMVGGEPPNRVHLRIEIEWSELRSGVAD